MSSKYRHTVRRTNCCVLHCRLGHFGVTTASATTQGSYWSATMSSHVIHV